MPENFVELHKKFVNAREEIHREIICLLSVEPKYREILDKYQKWMAKDEARKGKPWRFPTNALEESIQEIKGNTMEKAIEMQCQILQLDTIQERKKQCTDILFLFQQEYQESTFEEIRLTSGCYKKNCYKNREKPLKTKIIETEDNKIMMGACDKKNQCFEINDPLWMEMFAKLHLWDVEQNIVTWLKKIARNFALDYFKKTATESVDPPEDVEICYASESLTLDYALNSVVTHFQTICQSNEAPEQIAIQKHWISSMYCAIELTAFDKKWTKALELMEAEQSSCHKPYLPEYLDDHKEKSLSAHIVSLFLESGIRIKPYPILIRYHYLEGISYQEIAITLNIAEETAKDYTEKSVELLEVILKKFVEDPKEYIQYRDISLERTLELAFKLTGVLKMDNFLQKYKELVYRDLLDGVIAKLMEEEVDHVISSVVEELEKDHRLHEQIACYGLRGIALYPQDAQSILKKFWQECSCERNAERKKSYCWEYIEKILSCHYHKGHNVEEIEEEFNYCRNFQKDFTESFRVLCLLFRRVVSKLGLSLHSGILYYRWMNHSIATPINYEGE